MHLSWTAASLEDRDALLTWLGKRNPKAAVSLDDRIEREAEQLLQFPASGRPGRVSGTRELVVTRTKYVLIYTVKGHRIRILCVLHGARQWP